MHFAACTAAQTWLPMLFSGADKPPKLPFLIAILTRSNTWFLGPTWVHPKPHLDRFRWFCRAHECDQQTGQTTL